MDELMNRVVTYEREGEIGILTINRPKALNAINSDVISEIGGWADKIAADLPRCVILTGSGEKSFVAGADIAEMHMLSKEEAADFARRAHAAFLKIENLPVPVIAAVNGFALGGGCELALLADIRLASEKAVFALPETGLGIMPGFGATQRLPRLIGTGRAAELVFTGRRMKAAEALSAGLVNAVYAPEELMEKAKEMAQTIAEKAPIGIRASKAAMLTGIGQQLTDALETEAVQFASCFETQDQRNGMGAFLEKRTPDPYVNK